ncbi:MAG: glycosyltransferase [Desulfovibrio sp.]|jgi:glycosyltransferase involved in cell wall biosynthesis|nr:glycosyltransferase [Desulfovibrio sp.]
MRFSIIMAVLNGARFLQRALNSVLTQTSDSYEIIVQDGGSADGSLEILKAYEKRAALVSEPDNGIYDAWNKALVRAGGDWALFLGADDFLISENALRQSEAYLSRVPPHVDFVYGNLALGREGRPKTKISSSLASVYSQFLLGIGLPFPATFVRVETLKRHGFDPSFRIAGDLDVTARRLGPDNVLHMPHFVTFMEHGGISDNPAFADRLLEERQRVLRRHILPKASMIAERCLAYLPGDPPPEGDAP